LRGKTIAILGLTYKSGTNTLHRSWAIDLAEWLHDQGAYVRAYDPLVSKLPKELKKRIHLEATLKDALREADGAVIVTDQKDFRNLSEVQLRDMRRAVVVDPNGVAFAQLGAGSPSVEYICVGVSSVEPDMTAVEPKDILITGASGVIGSAISRRLARAGYRLHLTARDLAKLTPLLTELQEKYAITPTTYLLDLAQADQTEEVISQYFKNSPSPYGLVCNAGNLGVLGEFAQISTEEWLKGIQENFVAQVRLIHAFVKGIEAKKIPDARIVALSGAGLGGNSTFDHFTSYSTSKAALTHMVEALAPELTKIGLRINAVSPGQVSSGLTETAIRAGTERAGQHALTAQKCKETGGVSPDLAAQLVEYLFSPAAKEITGRLLSARFDREIVQKNAATISKDPNLFRLRRIDDALFQTKR
jgi:NAD(P)-dependent dehydrogenase (short-subunit alcohol dehydrogenase family)